MVLAAEFGSGQVLWSIFWFFLFFMWIWLVITVFIDVFRSDDISGPAKAIWTIAIIVLPYLGVFVYLVARGDKMGERQARAMSERDQAARSYIRGVTGGGGGADELAKLAELHAKGAITDDEFARAKARVTGG